MSSSSLTPTQTLLRALVKRIDDSKMSANHLPETAEFLDGRRQHVIWYDELLHRVDYAINDDILRISAVGEIGRLIAQVIDYIKALCEGTTDCIPFTLAAWLKYELGSLTHSALGVALVPFPNLNYFYQDIGKTVQSAFGDLDRFINGNIRTQLGQNDLVDPPALPSDLILIGFQYAMSNDILFNSILFHELGHHVYIDSKIREKYMPQITIDITARFTAQVPDFATLPPIHKTQLIRDFSNVVERWLNELFSDVFAVAIIGPQFCFSAHDMAFQKARSTAFSLTHPAPALRQVEQWKTLEDIGWVNPPEAFIAPNSTFRVEASTHFSQLRGTSPTVWSLDPRWNNPLHTACASIAIDEFLRRSPQIRVDAQNAVPDRVDRCKEFWRLGPAIVNTLNQGIVPSTIVTSGVVDDIPLSRLAPPNCFQYNPRPTTVVNSARYIYQDGCKEIKKLWGGSSANQLTRDQITKVHLRLSEWTQKAVSDWLLINGVS